MSLRRIYQNYQEVFLAAYALIIIGAIVFFYVSGIFSLVRVATEATSIKSESSTEVDFKLEEAKAVLEQTKISE
ncbi:MAG: hypothetical protein V1856_01155 [Candidatus Liptonbacteria bacterium]